MGNRLLCVKGTSIDLVEGCVTIFFVLERVRKTLDSNLWIPWLI